MKRKQIMPLALGIIFTMCLISTKAQEAPKKTERKEIIIREKAGIEEKMTIVVDGDKVTINGKPLAEYDGENIIIRKKNLESLAPYARAYPRTPAMPRIPRVPAVPYGPELFEFSFDEDDFSDLKTEPRARLGVISEKDTKGAKLTEVMPESAAAKAGLKVGDIISAVDGKKVDGPESLSEQILSKKPGEESEITYLRDKKTIKMKVKLGADAGNTARVFRFEAPNMEMDHEIARSKPKLGVRIEDTEEGNGVKVIDVAAGSAAEKAGFKKDDIITHINDKKIEHTDHARGALRESANKTSYPVTVLRNGKPFNMTVKTPRELKKADL